MIIRELNIIAYMDSLNCVYSKSIWIRIVQEEKEIKRERESGK